jgi:hypothetical protein
MRSAKLKMAFNQAKDRQRILQEAPEVIGYATLPFIIYKGCVHLSAWYKEADILCN